MGLAIATLVLGFSGCSDDVEPPVPCLPLQQCGVSGSGEPCGVCEKTSACGDPRCISGYLCGQAPTLDSCDCVGDCRPVGHLTRVLGLVNGDGGLNGLRGVYDTVATVDGRYVYVAARTNRGTRAFVDLPDGTKRGGRGQDRTGNHQDTRGTQVTLADGAVSQFEHIGDRLFRRNILAVPLVRALALSTELSRLYMATAEALEWGAIDPETGAVSVDHDLIEGGARDLDVASPWVAAVDGQALLLFEETEAGLTPRAQGNHASLVGAHRVLLGPQGRFVYVASFEKSLIQIWQRTADGLEPAGEMAGMAGLDRPDALALSPAGDLLYASGFCDDNIGVFRRAADTGLLTFAGSAYAAGRGRAGECPNALEPKRVPDDEPDHRHEPGEEPGQGVFREAGVGNPGGLAVTADGAELIVASYFGSRLTRFSRVGEALIPLDDVDASPAYVDFTLGGFGAEPIAGFPGVLKGWTTVTPLATGGVVASGYMANVITLMVGDQVREQVQQGDGGVVRLGGAYNLDLSPDGRHVYVAARNHGELAGFAYDSEDGSLTEARWSGPHDKAGSGGMTNVVVVRPGGEHVYGVDSQNGTLRIYDRAVDTGALTSRQTIALPDCVGRPSFPVDVVSSHDGSSLYVADFQTDGLSCALHLRRSSDGSLGDPQVYDNDSLRGIEAIVLTPDDTFAYAASHLSGSVTPFERDVQTGSLSALPHFEHAALEGAEAVALGPDSLTVYASSPVRNSLLIMNRDPGDGLLTYRQHFQDDSEGTETEEAAGIAVSPDGSRVYLASRKADTITVYDVDEEGMLTLSQTVVDPEVLDWPTGLVMANDGRHLIATAVLSSAVSVWRISDGKTDGCGGNCP